MSERRLRMGIVGLGRAFTVMLPTLLADRRVELVAAADPRSEATQRFAAEFGARAYDGVEALCANPDVEVVYVATPHEHHAAHVAMATAHGKHVLVEKPMAITLAECRQMIVSADRAGVARTQAASGHRASHHAKSRFSGAPAAPGRGEQRRDDRESR